jgi:hypothetical protein
MGVSHRGVHSSHLELLLTSTHIDHQRCLRFHRHTLFRAVGDREGGINLRVLQLEMAGAENHSRCREIPPRGAYANQEWYTNVFEQLYPQLDAPSDASLLTRWYVCCLSIVQFR